MHSRRPPVCPCPQAQKIGFAGWIPRRSFRRPARLRLDRCLADVDPRRKRLRFADGSVEEYDILVFMVL
jgi:hypothetical protein